VLGMEIDTEATDAGISAGPKAHNHISLGHRPRSTSPPLRYKGQRPAPSFNPIRIVHRIQSHISLRRPGIPPEMIACDGVPSAPRYRRSGSGESGEQGRRESACWKQAGQQMPKVQRAIGLATQVRVPRAMRRRFLAYYVGIKRAEEDSGYA
jgi:hypothetical protein